jgi:hypothetical protein
MLSLPFLEVNFLCCDSVALQYLLQISVMPVLIESGYCLLCLNQESYDVLDIEFGTVWKQFSHYTMFVINPTALPALKS